MAAVGSVSVGLTATLICPSSAVVTLMNTGAAIVYIGGPGVTTSVYAIALPANMTEPIQLPIDSNATGLLSNQIYGISGSAAQNVNYYSAVYGS